MLTGDQWLGSQAERIRGPKSHGPAPSCHCTCVLVLPKQDMLAFQKSQWAVKEPWLLGQGPRPLYLSSHIASGFGQAISYLSLWLFMVGGVQGLENEPPSLHVTNTSHYWGEAPSRLSCKQHMSSWALGTVLFLLGLRRVVEDGASDPTGT